MKTILLLAGLLSFSLSSFAEENIEALSVLHEYDYACRDVQVHIDRIERNKFIEGHVTGLPQEAHKLFKVVFYVKTNRWYIHPYENNSDQDGDGYSFTYLKSDGTFVIKSVRRDIPSRYLAAVLFPRQHRIVNSARRLHPLWGIFGGLTKHACNYTMIKGNGDFFLPQDSLEVEEHNPLEIRVRNTMPSMIDLGWKHVKGFNTYDLLYRRGKNRSVTKITNISSPYSLTGLLRGEVYSLQLRGKSDDGDLYSREIFVRTQE